MPKGQRGGSAPGERRGGRKKGTRNKSTLAAKEIMQKHKYCPITGMIRVAQNAEETGDLSTAGRMHSELSQYCYSKFKSTDQSDILELIDGDKVTEIRLIGRQDAARDTDNTEVDPDI